MKVYRLQQQVYESDMDFIHNMSQTQNLLFIPEFGILGYRRDKFDFFNDDPENFKRVQAVIGGRKDEEVKYLGEVDLPDDLVMKVVAKGKESNKAKSSFEQNAKTLVEKVAELSK